MTRYLMIILLCLALLQTAPAAAAPPALPAVGLAAAGKALLPVVTAPEADERVKGAAAVLADYLGRISGAQFEVTTGEGAAGIAVGLPGDFPALGLQKNFNLQDPFKREDYLLRSHSKGLYIIGATDPAVENAVWDLLYRLGHRQFFPGKKWEIIPSVRSLRIAVDTFQSPAYIQRSFGIGHGYWGYNKAPFEEWSVRNRARAGFNSSAGHVYQAIMSARKKEFEAHPEYLGLVKGERKSSKFCISNPGLRRLVVDYALEHFKKNPNADSVSMEPSDGGNWCECPECAAMGSVTDRALTLANEVAVEINKVYPGKYVGMLAYNEHSPPPSIKVHPKVIIRAANGFIRGGYTFKGIMDGWHSKGAANMGITEYYDVFVWSFSLPAKSRISDLDYVKKSIPQYHAMGARFMSGGISDNWGATGPGAYIASRILWDLKEADRVDALVEDFLDKCFGKAKEPMREFYRLIDAGNKNLLSDDLIGRMYRSLESAYKLSGDPAVVARLNDLTLYTRYVDLYHAYTTASGKERQRLFEETVKFSYRIRETQMVHSKPAYMWICQFDNNVKIPAEAAAGVPEGKNPWKDSTPFTQEEIARIVSEGVAGHKLLDFAAVNYSSDLVPAAGPLRLPEVARGNFGGSPMGVNTYHTWLEKPGDIKLKISGGHIVHYRKIASNVQTTLLAAGNPMVGERVAYDDSVKPDGEVFDVLLKSPFTGLHSIQVNPPSNRAIADIEGGLLWTVECSLERKYGFTPAWSLYFYVPKGTKIVGGFATTVRPGDMLDGSGKKVFSFKSLEKPGYFNVAVPEGEDGKLWKMQGCYGAICLMTVPPYLARSGAELLLPREVVEKDAK